MIEALALNNVSIVDPRNGELAHDMSILIDNGRIVRVTPAGTVQQGASVKQVDAHHQFAVPGYNDMHVHALIEKNPSAGLAESLDFPVVIGGTEGLSLLQGLMQRSSPLRWAALAALDAWVLQQRATAIPLLAGSAAEAGALDAGSRAALLSRADIRDEAQRAAIESYLGAPAVPQAAKAEFLRQFPNQNMILANHLVTTSQPMSLEESARLDAAALQFVERSIQAGTYPELGKELDASRERLAGFVASARRGGKL